MHGVQEHLPKHYVAYLHHMETRAIYLTPYKTLGAQLKSMGCRNTCPNHRRRRIHGVQEHLPKKLGFFHTVVPAPHWVA